MCDGYGLVPVAAVEVPFALLAVASAAIPAAIATTHPRPAARDPPLFAPALRVRVYREREVALAAITDRLLCARIAVQGGVVCFDYSYAG